VRLGQRLIDSHRGNGFVSHKTIHSSSMTGYENSRGLGFPKHNPKPFWSAQARRFLKWEQSSAESGIPNTTLGCLWTNPLFRVNDGMRALGNGKNRPTLCEVLGGCPRNIALMKANPSLPLSGKRPRARRAKRLDGVEKVKVAFRFGKSHPVFLPGNRDRISKNHKFREPILPIPV
jgi:hypothetical protein